MSLDSTKRVALAAPAISTYSFAAQLTVPSGSSVDLFSAVKSYADSESVVLPGFPLALVLQNVSGSTAVEIRTQTGSAGFPVPTSSSFALPVAQRPNAYLSSSLYLSETSSADDSVVAVLALY